MTQPKIPVTKKLLDYLPAIYHGQDEADGPAFLELFLRAFERILFGGPELKNEDSAEDSAQTIEDGLEEQVAHLPLLFDPQHTPEEFLPWLAGWAALSFHPDLSLERRRNLLANIIPLYRIRGTRAYIEQLLTLCLDTFITVTDTEISEFQIGHRSTVGVASYVGGGPPHFFSVKLIAPQLNQQQKEIQTAIAHNILSLAKPAHTFYDLTLVSPRMQLGVDSTVGVDTVLVPL